MSDQSLLIPINSDRKIVETFSEVSKIIGLVTFTGQTCAEVSFNYDVNSGPSEILKKILEGNGKLIAHVGVSVPGLQINFYRGENNAQYNTALWDRLHIRGDHQGDPATKLAAVSFLLKELQPYEAGRAPTALDAQTAGELVAIHTSILEKLEHANADLATQTTELQRQLRINAEALIAEERKKIEAWRDEAANKLHERDKDLDARECALDEVKKNIDARSSTFARREDREKLLNEVKTRVVNFGVSEATARKRFPVQMGMLLLMMVFATLLIFTGYEIDRSHSERDTSLNTLSALSLLAEKQSDKDATMKLTAKISDMKAGQPDYFWVWLRFSAWAIGLVGAIIYYIRWQDRWANQHATAEWQLRQFQLDISRANWVIESGLEWKKETGKTMPENLVEHITHGLFTKENEPAQVLHPADELASALLGNASKLNLKTPIGDVEFNKPSKIPKTTE